QWTLSGHVGVQLAQTACRGIAWVAEFLVPSFPRDPVEFGQTAARHVDLTTDLHGLRSFISPQTEWNTGNGAYVGRDFLTLVPIPASRATNQDSVFVGQIDRQTVQLGLRHICDLLHRKPLAYTLIEI